MTDGKGFGQFKFSSGREITEEQARAVGLPYLKAGIKAVRDENAKIVYLGHKT